MKAIFMLATVSLLLLFNFASRTRMAASAQPVESQQSAAAPGPRIGHCLVYHERLRQVVLLDRYQSPYQPELGEVWSWNGKQWVLIPGSGPMARSMSGAVYDSRRKRIVLYGGNRGIEDLKGDTWEWDGKSWSQMADTSVGTRDHHVMAYDAARGRAVMYGGETSTRSWATDT